MVWIVEKKVFYYILDLGFERVKIPLRVKFEFDVQDGKLVDNSLTWQVLYNKKMLQDHFPKLQWEQLEEAIDKTVQKGIGAYLQQCGYLNANEGP